MSARMLRNVVRQEKGQNEPGKKSENSWNISGLRSVLCIEGVFIVTKHEGDRG